MWVALHTVAIATDLTSYRHTDPMYPPTLLPLLSTPALWVFYSSIVRRKRPYGLNQNIFFTSKKSEYQRFRAEGKEALENAYFPRVKRLQNVHSRRKGWWPSVTHLHVYFHVPFYSLYSYPDYTDPVSLCLPHPQLPVLTAAPGRVITLFKGIHVDWSGRTGIDILIFCFLPVELMKCLWMPLPDLKQNQGKLKKKNIGCWGREWGEEKKNRKGKHLGYN